MRRVAGAGMAVALWMACAAAWPAPGEGFHYVVSAEGEVQKRDAAGDVLARAPLAAGAHALAVSARGGHVAVAYRTPPQLLVLDADLKLLRQLPLRGMSGEPATEVSALVDAPLRQSFVLALAGVPEVWEVSYNPGAEEIAVGKIHDFQYREGAFVPGYLNPRRSRLPVPLAALRLTPEQHELVGTDPSGQRLHIVNLDVRKRIAEQPLPFRIDLARAHAPAGARLPFLSLPAAAGPAFLCLEIATWHLRGPLVPVAESPPAGDAACLPASR